MIIRNQFKELEELSAYFPAVGIIGPRQCGKTTLAKEFIKNHSKECVYIDLESPTDRNKLAEPEFFFDSNKDKCIVLDEIQRMSELFPILRSVIDNYRKPGRFIILGSATPLIMRDSSESLAGRIAYIELSPFNVTEIDVENYEKHWLKGGFPESYLSQSKKYSEKWIENFVTSYIERDLPQLGLSSSATIIRNFWTMIAHGHGDIFNTNNYSRSLGVTAPTIKKYLYFLEESFLVYSLKPFYINIKKRLVKTPKIYIRDSGILHYLTNTTNKDILFTSLIVGASWEGYVIEQIRQLVRNKFEIYYYRTHHGTECDLVLVKGIKPEVSIEIKYTSTPKLTKSLAFAIEDLKTDLNFIITPKSDDYLLKKNIRVCSLRVFLEKYLNEMMQK